MAETQKQEAGLPYDLWNGKEIDANSKIFDVNWNYVNIEDDRDWFDGT